MTVSSLVELPGLLPRAEVALRQRAEMFDLLSRHFEGVTREQFARDLEEKDWVIQIRDVDRRLVGFSTLRAATSYVTDEPVTTIYSGETIVAPEAWRSPALARAWIAGVNHIRASHPRQRCYWLLLTSGFRTYRFLPVFWREFFPHFERPTPAPMQRLLEQLAREGYGDQFDAPSGIVRLAQPQRLRGQLAAIPGGREHNPHVAFFLARNPGHARGDELVCITEICDSNLTAAGRRMLTTAPVG